MNDKKIEATHINSLKIDAKLRMLANCDQDVNEVRAMQSGNLGLSTNVTQKAARLATTSRGGAPVSTPSLKKAKLTQPSDDVFTNVFIEVKPKKKGQQKKLPGEIIRIGNFISSQLPLTEINEVSKEEYVIGIEASRVLKLAHPVISKTFPKLSLAPKFPELRIKYPSQHDVLIGIIDVGGFDFAHPEFLDTEGKTKFLRIWDQGSDFRKPPKLFNYGAEFTADHLNAAIRNAKSVGVPPTELERQSSRTIGAHATHVASIAAGNSGVLPTAKIAAVTIALQEGDLDRRKSFYDSACLVHAVSYLFSVADELNMPISINISLGTNGHAHDGSDITSRWIDSELNIPGRCICIAAGNSGQEKALSENDYGFTMGRIHTKTRIEATGLSKDIFWTVVGDGVVDFSENELELWYTPQDRISVMIKPPESDWIGPVHPMEYIENKQLADDSFISIYNDLYHFSNGHNYIGIFLSPNFKDVNNRIPVKSGIWQVRLLGTEIRKGDIDGWIERDDPRPLGAFGNKQYWNFPSFFTEMSNHDSSSISSLACARYVIAVANYDTVSERVNISSSQGPTRDNRTKPEVLAPGTDITAAKGFSNAPDDLYISMTGTSMASPYVCGIAAWMLSIEKNLSASQIQGIMVRTCKPLPGEDYLWKNTSGFGVIDEEACFKEAKTIRTKKDITS